MRRIVRRRRSKRAITLVELVVAMTLMAIFAASCVALIYPISHIYTSINEESRAQLLADSVVDSLRAECARTYITGANDVWISSGTGDSVMTAMPSNVSGPGPVLVIRKSYEYCETLSTNYIINGTLCNEVYGVEKAGDNNPQTGNITSRAIYRMFSTVPVPEAQAAGTVASPVNYVHFGYFKVGAEMSNGVYPAEYYDFTDPFTAPTYGDFTVQLNFHDIAYGSSGTIPAYVLVDVMIFDGTANVYTRSNVALSFASPALS